MSKPISEEFIQVRYDILDKKLNDLHKCRREDFNDIQAKLDVIEARLDTIQSMFKTETLILGGLSASFATIITKLLGQR